MKQAQHKRSYQSGKITLVNPGIRKGSFFAYKRIPERWLVVREIGTKEPVWNVQSPKDKNLTYFQLVEYGHYPSSPYGDADNDGVQNLFDKHPLDARIRKEVPPTVKAGNTKLTNVIGIFSLPRYYTCPGKTELCTKYCYAESPEMYRAGVVYSRNKNLAWTLRSNFVPVMSAIIKNMGLGWFRIHEAGDFYNQTYFDKWAQIARNNPRTRFLAYTKNWKLDFTKKPSNFTVRYSTDLSSKFVRNDLPQCYVGIEKPVGYFLCKKKCEPGFCMECWKATNVYIPVHSLSKKNIEEMFYKSLPELPQKVITQARRKQIKVYKPLLIAKT